MVGGTSQVSGPALLRFSLSASSASSASKRGRGGEADEGGVKGAQSTAAPPSTSPQSAQSTPTGGKAGGRASAAASSAGSSIPRKRSARQSVAATSTSPSPSSAAAASPSLSFPSVVFNRPTPPHLDVSVVRLEDTPLLVAGEERGGGGGGGGQLQLQGGAGHGGGGGGSSLSSNGVFHQQLNGSSPYASLSAISQLSGASSSSLSSTSSSAVSSSSVPSLSSQLLGSMLNISQSNVSMVVDPNQFPYSGPLLASARVKPAFPVILPSSARWFDLDSVHERERRAFPDWFEGREGRSEAVLSWYCVTRNAIVTAYRANPRVYLTITACRRQIAADAGALTRIHLFLQHEGLINYHVDPGSQPLMGSTSKEKLSYPIYTHSTLQYNHSQQPRAHQPHSSTLTPIPSTLLMPAAAAAAAARPSVRHPVLCAAVPVVRCRPLQTTPLWRSSTPSPPRRLPHPPAPQQPPRRVTLPPPLLPPCRCLRCPLHCPPRSADCWWGRC